MPAFSIAIFFMEISCSSGKENDGYLIDLNLAVRLNDNIAFGGIEQDRHKGGYKCSHRQAS